MRVEIDEPCPLPEDPVLAAACVALRDGGHWGFVFDSDWRLVFATDDVRRSFGGSTSMVALVIGENIYGSASLELSRSWPFPPLWETTFPGLGSSMLADFGGDRARLKAEIDPSLHHLVDEMTANGDEMRTYVGLGTGVDWAPPTVSTVVRLRDDAGSMRGSVLLLKPAASMATIGVMVFEQDLEHLARMQQVISADRRSTAILFADVESSSPLARRLSTASYFALNRRLVRAADNAVLETGGLVGRHVGDGVVAFFPATTFPGESNAARACIEAARAIRAGVRAVAERSELDPSELVMRFGLHWGATPYIGSIISGARTEVTALGDEINEAARIEASATGGRMLASKQLIERLNRVDAAALDIDTEHIAYTQLGDLDTAPEKARRDASSIAVCQL
jgi:class 3 adenylate cyclase